MRTITFALLLCGCLHAGGAGPAGAEPEVPSYLLGIGEPRRFPSSAYITAAASSGSSVAQAEDAAKAAVAAQIRSSIESEFRSLESESVESGQVSSGESRQRRVLTRASFDRAELIRIVERRRMGSQFYALAALDRAEASQALAADYEATAVPLRALIDDVLGHSRDSRAFAAAWSRARPLSAKVSSLGAARTVIEGRRPASFDADLRRIDDLGAARALVLQSAAVRLLGNGGAAADATAVVGRALTSLGLPLVAVDDAKKALDVHVDVEESFPRGVGICCTWRLSLRVDGTSRPLDLQPMACDLRDRNVAREALVRQLGPDQLAGPLRAALGSLLPVDE